MGSPDRSGNTALRVVSIKLPSDLVERLDAAAGPGKRTEWIREAVEQRLVAHGHGASARVRTRRRPVPGVRQTDEAVERATRTPHGESRAFDEACGHTTERRLPYGVFCADCGARLR